MRLLSPQLLVALSVGQHLKHYNVKIKRLIIMGFLSLLFGLKSYGQSKLIDITSISEEGFCDLVFNITDKQLDKYNNWILVAKGQYKSTVVGLKIKIRNGLSPGLNNGKLDQSGMTRNAGEFINIGLESDNFIKIVSGLYGFNSGGKFSKKNIPFDCFSLNSGVGYLDKGNFKFKLFLDSQDINGLYSELFLNIDLASGLIRLNEKDPGYRERVIKILTK